MPSFSQLYTSLLENPDIQPPEGQDRDAYVVDLAKQRLRQFKNNEKALSLGLSKSRVEEFSNFITIPIKKSMPITSVGLFANFLQLEVDWDDIMDEVAMNNMVSSVQPQIANAILSQYSTNDLQTEESRVQVLAEMSNLQRYQNDRLQAGHKKRYEQWEEAVKASGPKNKEIAEWNKGRDEKQHRPKVNAGAAPLKPKPTIMSLPSSKIKNLVAEKVDDTDVIWEDSHAHLLDSSKEGGKKFQDWGSESSWVDHVGYKKKVADPTKAPTDEEVSSAEQAQKEKKDGDIWKRQEEALRKKLGDIYPNTKFKDIDLNAKQNRHFIHNLTDKQAKSVRSVLVGPTYGFPSAHPDAVKLHGEDGFRGILENKFPDLAGVSIEDRLRAKLLEKYSDADGAFSPDDLLAMDEESLHDAFNLEFTENEADTKRGYEKDNKPNARTSEARLKRNLANLFEWTDEDKQPFETAFVANLDKETGTYLPPISNYFSGNALKHLKQNVPGMDDEENVRKLLKEIEAKNFRPGLGVTSRKLSQPDVSGEKFNNIFGHVWQLTADQEIDEDAKKDALEKTPEQVLSNRSNESFFSNSLKNNNGQFNDWRNNIHQLYMQDMGHDLQIPSITGIHSLDEGPPQQGAIQGPDALRQDDPAVKRFWEDKDAFWDKVAKLTNLPVSLVTAGSDEEDDYSNNGINVLTPKMRKSVYHAMRTVYNEQVQAENISDREVEDLQAPEPVTLDKEAVEHIQQHYNNSILDVSRNPVGSQYRINKMMGSNDPEMRRSAQREYQRLLVRNRPGKEGVDAEGNPLPVGGTDVVGDQQQDRNVLRDEASSWLEDTANIDVSLNLASEEQIDEALQRDQEIVTPEEVQRIGDLMQEAPPIVFPDIVYKENGKKDTKATNAAIKEWKAKPEVVEWNKRTEGSEHGYTSNPSLVKLFDPPANNEHVKLGGQGTKVMSIRKRVDSKRQAPAQEAVKNIPATPIQSVGDPEASGDPDSVAGITPADKPSVEEDKEETPEKREPINWSSGKSGAEEYGTSLENKQIIQDSNGDLYSVERKRGYLLDLDGINDDGMPRSDGNKTINVDPSSPEYDEDMEYFRHEIDGKNLRHELYTETPKEETPKEEAVPKQEEAAPKQPRLFDDSDEVDEPVKKPAQKPTDAKAPKVPKGFNDIKNAILEVATPKEKDAIEQAENLGDIDKASKLTKRNSTPVAEIKGLDFTGSAYFAAIRSGLLDLEGVPTPQGDKLLDLMGERWKDVSKSVATTSDRYIETYGRKLTTGKLKDGIFPVNQTILHQVMNHWNNLDGNKDNQVQWDSAKWNDDSTGLVKVADGEPIDDDFFTQDFTFGDDPYHLRGTQMGESDAGHDVFSRMLMAGIISSRASGAGTRSFEDEVGEDSPIKDRNTDEDYKKLFANYKDGEFPGTDEDKEAFERHILANFVGELDPQKGVHQYSIENERFEDVNGNAVDDPSEEDFVNAAEEAWKTSSEKEGMADIRFKTEDIFNDIMITGGILNPTPQDIANVAIPSGQPAENATVATPDDIKNVVAQESSVPPNPNEGASADDIEAYWGGQVPGAGGAGQPPDVGDPEVGLREKPEDEGPKTPTNRIERQIQDAKDDGLLDYMIAQEPYTYEDEADISEQLLEMKPAQAKKILQGFHTKKGAAEKAETKAKDAKEAEQEAEQKTQEELQAQEDAAKLKASQTSADDRWSQPQPDKVKPDREKMIERLAERTNQDVDDVREMYSEEYGYTPEDIRKLLHAADASHRQDKVQSQIQREGQDNKVANIEANKKLHDGFLMPDEFMRQHGEEMTPAEATSMLRNVAQHSFQNKHRFDEKGVGRMSELYHALVGQGADIDTIGEEIEKAEANGISYGSPEWDKHNENNEKLGAEKLAQEEADEKDARAEDMRKAQRHEDAVGKAFGHPNHEHANKGIHFDMEFSDDGKVYGHGGANGIHHEEGESQEHDPKVRRTEPNRAEHAPYDPDHSDAEQDVFQRIHEHRQRMKDLGHPLSEAKDQHSKSQKERHETHRKRQDVLHGRFARANNKHWDDHKANQQQRQDDHDQNIKDIQEESQREYDSIDQTHQEQLDSIKTNRKNDYNRQRAANTREISPLKKDAEKGQKEVEKVQGEQLEVIDKLDSQHEQERQDFDQGKGEWDLDKLKETNPEAAALYADSDNRAILRQDMLNDHSQARANKEAEHAESIDPLLDKQSGLDKAVSDKQTEYDNWETDFVKGTEQQVRERGMDTAQTRAKARAAGENRVLEATSAHTEESSRLDGEANNNHDKMRKEFDSISKEMNSNHFTDEFDANVNHNNEMSELEGTIRQQHKDASNVERSLMDEYMSHSSKEVDLDDHHKKSLSGYGREWANIQSEISDLHVDQEQWEEWALPMPGMARYEENKDSEGNQKDHIQRREEFNEKMDELTQKRTDFVRNIQTASGQKIGEKELDRLIDVQTPRTDSHDDLDSAKAEYDENMQNEEAAKKNLLSVQERIDARPDEDGPPDKDDQEARVVAQNALKGAKSLSLESKTKHDEIQQKIDDEQQDHTLQQVFMDDDKFERMKNNLHNDELGMTEDDHHRQTEEMHNEASRGADRAAQEMGDAQPDEDGTPPPGSPSPTNPNLVYKPGPGKNWVTRQSYQAAVAHGLLAKENNSIAFSNQGGQITAHHGDDSYHVNPLSDDNGQGHGARSSQELIGNDIHQKANGWNDADGTSFSDKIKNLREGDSFEISHDHFGKDSSLVRGLTGQSQETPSTPTSPDEPEKPDKTESSAMRFLRRTGGAMMGAIKEEGQKAVQGMANDLRDTRHIKQLLTASGEGDDVRYGRSMPNKEHIGDASMKNEMSRLVPSVFRSQDRNNQLDVENKVANLSSQYQASNKYQASQNKVLGRANVTNPASNVTPKTSNAVSKLTQHVDASRTPSP